MLLTCGYLHLEHRKHGLLICLPAAFASGMCSCCSTISTLWGNKTRFESQPTLPLRLGAFGFKPVLPCTKSSICFLGILCPKEMRFRCTTSSAPSSNIRLASMAGNLPLMPRFRNLSWVILQGLKRLWTSSSCTPL